MNDMKPDEGGEIKMGLDVMENDMSEQGSLDDDRWTEVSSGEGKDYDDFDRFTFDEVGDELSGKIAGITEGDYEDSDGYIIEIDEDTGRIVWTSAVQLKSKLGKLDVGDPVKIIYDGESETDTGRLMKNFTVKTK